VFVFLRKRRRQEVEEEYRRSAAVRGFVQKPALDNRLDPVMVQKRDSVGSIADNQDYSRKILRVYQSPLHLYPRLNSAPITLANFATPFR